MSREDYESVPDDRKVFSPDASKAVYWYKSRQRQDRYDDDTNYRIIVWDVETRREIASFDERAYLALETGISEGKPIIGVRFSDDSKSLIYEYSDGTTGIVELPADSH